MNKNIIATLLSGVVIFTSIDSFAQTVPEAAKTTADPARIEHAIKEADLSDRLSSNISVSSDSTVKAPKGADKIFFELDNLIIEGATVYGEEDLLEIYSSYLGNKISLQDLFAIANNMTNKYRNEGYILSRVIVPAQEIDGNTAKLKVVEGFIDQIIIQGDENERLKGSFRVINDYIHKIQMSGPLNASNLERVLLFINDLPGVKARSILSPSESVVGASNITIIIERNKIEGYVGLDNYGSRYIGRYQGVASASLNSLFGHNEKITATVAYAPKKGLGKEMAYGALNVDVPFRDNGTWFNSSLSITETKPGYNLEQFNVRGQSIYGKVGLTHKLIRSRTDNLSLRYFFDWRNIRSSNRVDPNREDRIRALRLGMKYDYVDNILSPAFNVIDFELSQGLNLFGASNEGQANMSRLKGDPQFLKANLEVQRLQHIRSNVNLLIAAKGQFASDNLPSSEEFGVGGSNYGRGYDSSEIVGDHGVAAKIEIQWKEPKEIGWLDSYQLYGFYDAGHVWNSDASTSDLKRETATSTGVGVRADITKETQAGIYVAVPLNRVLQTENNEDARVFFNLSHRF